jgi:Holliday junction resolvase RusA-like endonuclease
MNETKIIVSGKPIAKKRPRFVRKGNFVSTYNDQLTEEGRFILDVKQQYNLPLIDGPISINLTFVMPRPKAHFGTGRNAGGLKTSAPKYHTKKPDIDNLVKFVFDCLNGIVWVDDAQIITLFARKIYGVDPVTIIMVESDFEI